jgi:predicted dehydrogenase
MTDALSRRAFLGDSATLAAGALILPRWILGGAGYRAPSARLNIACVGIGGMGMSNMAQLLDENIVAVCDVDFPYVERALEGRLRPNRDGVVNPQAVRLKEAYTRADKYADFRVMLERQRDIDAVVVATPDHLHAPIAAAAMQLGKHVYVQKPLTYSVYEARLLARLARENPRLVTEMGNQGHSMEGTRRLTELLASGLIGPVRTVHVWTDRPVRYWAQGIPRPVRPDPNVPPPAAPNPNAPPPQWNMRTVERAVLATMANGPHTPPPGLDWNLFLGPAPEIPYHPAYHPFAWRGWIDFGVGAIGDMGAHLLDQPYWALGLTSPTSITASSSPWGGTAQNPATYPIAMMAQLEFPARGAQPPVTLHWYDGGLMPPRPPFLPDEEEMAKGDGGGGIFVGEKGIIMYETYGNNPRIFPASLAEAAAAVPKTVPRIAVSHEANWAAACKGEAKPSGPFEYSAPLTEVMLLPIAALRAGQGKKVLFDTAAMQFTNAPDANRFLTREYRAGWAL